MLNKLVALILFLHPCHCQMKDSNRVEAIQKDAKRREDEFDPDWLSGALEHKFCERIEPEVPAGTITEPGEPVPNGTDESAEAGSESTEADLAASSDAEVATTDTAGDAPDGEQPAEPVAPAVKPAVKKVVKAA